MKEIQVAMSKAGHRVFRNNVGMLQDGGPSGRWVRFGLCEGSSDLIGITKTGRFLAIEVKKPGARTNPKRLAKQVAFLDMIRSMGGCGVMTSNVAEAIASVQSFEEIPS